MNFIFKLLKKFFYAEKADLELKVLIYKNVCKWINMHMQIISLGAQSWAWQSPLILYLFPKYNWGL